MKFVYKSNYKYLNIMLFELWVFFFEFKRKSFLIVFLCVLEIVGWFIWSMNINWKVDLLLKLWFVFKWVIKLVK